MPASIMAICASNQHFRIRYATGAAWAFVRKELGTFYREQ